MAADKGETPDFWKIGFKTLTPISLLREKHRLLKFVISMRKREGLTQTQLGRKADISQSRMAQIEAGIAKGPISFDLIFLLLEVLGRDIHVILRPRRQRNKRNRQKMPAKKAENNHEKNHYRR